MGAFHHPSFPLPHETFPCSKPPKRTACGSVPRITDPQFSALDTLNTEQRAISSPKLGEHGVGMRGGMPRACASNFEAHGRCPRQQAIQ